MRPIEAIGEYEVLGKLGKGACSTILKIRRHNDGGIYALKVVTVRDAEDLKYIDQAEHEFSISSKLDHPNLVKVYALEFVKGFFKVKGARLLLEYVDGLPLSECRGLPMLKLVEIAARVAAAMRYMHKRGVYHADIKPTNILVTTSGDVKIIDFGLAWREGDNKGRVQGTLEYLAPEQAKNKIVNVKTDIFNFGATFYRVFTSRTVPQEFRQRGVTSFAGIDRLVRPMREINPQVPSELDELIRRCIRVRPQDRPESMKEVRDRLRLLLKSLSAGR
jgi:serine/threonine-protein kinase